jgi:hypothetical protein
MPHHTRDVAWMVGWLASYDNDDDDDARRSTFFLPVGRQAGRQAAVRITQTADAMYHDTDVMIRFSGQLGEGKRRLIMEAKSTF